jgi:hyperosmotically inducible protein
VGCVAVAGCKREETTSVPSTSPPSAAAPSATAPQPGTAPPEKRSAGQTVDDATITAKIKTALLRASDVKGTAVDVDTVNGTVTLKGSVENQDQANRAIEIAQRADGVQSVVTQLTVKR